MDKNFREISEYEQRLSPKKKKKFKKSHLVANDVILDKLQNENCLCNVSESDFRQWFLAIITSDALTDPDHCDDFAKMQLLSVLQLIFDTCLKHNRAGNFSCFTSKILIHQKNSKSLPHTAQYLLIPVVPN